MSPECARRISPCQEITKYLEGGPFAKSYLEGGLGKHNNYGMPSVYHGYPIEVDDTYKVTSRKGEANNIEEVCQQDRPFMCVRTTDGEDGGLMGVEGGKDFSTYQVFWLEEMTVENKDDPDNRRVKGRVVNDYENRMVAPETGFLFTDALSGAA